jgi:hypothetical protein
MGASGKSDNFPDGHGLQPEQFPGARSLSPLATFVLTERTIRSTARPACLPGDAMQPTHGPCAGCGGAVASRCQKGLSMIHFW